METKNVENVSRAMSDDEIRELLKKRLIELDIEFTAKGHKSSDGDGRTAADIKEELRKNGS